MKTFGPPWGQSFGFAAGLLPGVERDCFRNFQGCRRASARRNVIASFANRAFKGAVTKINCSALHLSGDNCFPSNHLALSELPNSRHFNCRF
jgi:hypothetical protein